MEKLAAFLSLTLQSTVVAAPILYGHTHTHTIINPLCLCCDFDFLNWTLLFFDSSLFWWPWVDIDSVLCFCSNEVVIKRWVSYEFHFILDFTQQSVFDVIFWISIRLHNRSSDRIAESWCVCNCLYTPGYISCWILLNPGRRSWPPWMIWPYHMPIVLLACDLFHEVR